MQLTASLLAAALFLTSAWAAPNNNSPIIVGKPGSQPKGQAPVTARAGSLKPGEICSDSRQCMYEADCSGQTSFTIRECGNFNAACNTTQQCAYNSCQRGLCAGPAPLIVGKPGSQPKGQAPITARKGSVKIGGKCSDSRQCMGGADCYAQTAFTIAECGNFNAACHTDNQCSYNSCRDGLCSGPQKSS